MAHPSDALPKDVYIIGSTALSSTTGLTNGKRVFAVTNPTSAAIDASCTGSNYTYQTDAYKKIDTAQTIAVQPGATIYGSWSSVGGSGLLAYVS